jgi:4-hydroxy-tetrahydrodipicolinate synthase
MTALPGRFGLSCALATPFTDTGAVDLPRFAAHARWTLAEGCGSVTAFGTTGEGSSLGLSDRDQMFGALKAAGLDFRRQVIGGVMAASIEDAVAQSRQILNADGRALLLAPPFYFKGVSDEGLFAWFQALFAALGDTARDVILYNIPSVTAVPLPLDLITRLRRAYPAIVIGVKDSSGDWPYTQALLAEHNDLAILVGDERHLAAAVKLGSEGAICGVANLMPKRLLPLAMKGEGDASISTLVDALLKHPVTPAVKSLIADRAGDKGWLHARPPLKALTPTQSAQLRSEAGPL